MENKQEVVLTLLRSMSDLIYKLTFVSRDPTSTNGLELPIRSVRKKLDEFEAVFIDGGEKRDSDKMIEDLADEVNYFYYPIMNNKDTFKPFDVKKILGYREKIREIWRKQDKEKLDEK